jgi:hypothetical protein
MNSSTISTTYGDSLSGENATGNVSAEQGSTFPVSGVAAGNGDGTPPTRCVPPTRNAAVEGTGGDPTFLEADLADLIADAIAERRETVLVLVDDIIAIIAALGDARRTMGCIAAGEPGPVQAAHCGLQRMRLLAGGGR